MNTNPQTELQASLRNELAYVDWAEDRVEKGWTPYLLTFMFDHINNSEASLLHQMEREVERVYATHLPYICRCPKANSALGRLPIWLFAPDLPVSKRKKNTLADVLINDGLHGHALGLYPPGHRLRIPLAEHFEERQHIYIRGDNLLQRIDVLLVAHDVGKVLNYVRKSIAKKRIGEEAAFILPRSMHEVRT